MRYLLLTILLPLGGGLLGFVLGALSLDRFQKKWSTFGGKTASLFSGPPSSESDLNS